MRRTTRNLVSMTFLSKTTRLMALMPPATVYLCFRVYEKPPPPDGDRRQKGFVNLHRFLLACASRFPRFSGLAHCFSEFSCIVTAKN